MWPCAMVITQRGWVLGLYTSKLCLSDISAQYQQYLLHSVIFSVANWTWNMPFYSIPKIILWLGVMAVTWRVFSFGLIYISTLYPRNFSSQSELVWLLYTLFWIAVLRKITLFSLQLCIFSNTISVSLMWPCVMAVTWRVFSFTFMYISNLYPRNFSSKSWPVWLLYVLFHIDV